MSLKRTENIYFAMGKQFVVIAQALWVYDKSFSDMYFCVNGGNVI